MNLVRSFLCLSVAIGATVAAGCTTSRTAFPEEWDGLVRQPHPRLNAVFVKPDAEIRGYRNVLLDPLQTSFARNWDPNRGGRSLLTRLDAGDMSAIEDGLAELFHEIFRAELERGGYQLVTERGPDTIRVTPGIVDLFITAPDTMSAGRGRTYTANSGRMTLVVELRDSLTDEILARAVDTRSGRHTSTLTITNRVTNTADARRAIGVWATALREALDELYGRASAATPAESASPASG